jgi:hypothetical protein
MQKRKGKGKVKEMNRCVILICDQDKADNADSAKSRKELLEMWCCVVFGLTLLKPKDEWRRELILEVRAGRMK